MKSFPHFTQFPASDHPTVSTEIRYGGGCFPHPRNSLRGMLFRLERSEFFLAFTEGCGLVGR